ncbi:hypothetical protein, partial [Brevibacillus borstelensis]|uniref:hypothetical protein n=1 Tax=Brevibacillus borstelensis TaxID=45462 RepID=UPI001D13B53C
LPQILAKSKGRFCRGMLASAFFMASELRWNSAVFRRNSLHFYPAINSKIFKHSKILNVFYFFNHIAPPDFHQKYKIGHSLNKILLATP